MTINDSKLLEILWNENDELCDFDELDLTNKDILEKLSKIKNITIFFRPSDNPEVTVKQLEELVKVCPNIEIINLYSINQNTKNILINQLVNTSIDYNVKSIIIKGFGYDYSSLSNKILSSNSETIIHLDNNTNSVNDFSYIFGEEKLRRQLRFDHHANNELENLYNQLVFGEISLAYYKEYKDFLINYKKLYIKIGNVSEISLSELEEIKKNKDVKGICITCGYSKDRGAQYYSLDEYENIRKVIDQIIRMVKIPKEDNPNREKIIFAQIYKILGKNIRYDYYAISKEGKKNEQLARDCRNLKNGLLGINRRNKRELLTVCAGYATILQNLCACFNIKCDYISSSSKEIEMPGIYVIKGPKNYENGTNDPMGHGYNAVYLDGKAYLCDLTWDADSMKSDNLGAHFLKSYEEFYASHKDEGFSSDNVEVITQDGRNIRQLDPNVFINSCTIREQIELFGNVAKSNIEEMINEGYLADFAMKNIEYIKQVKGKVGATEYLKLVKQIHYLEEYIKSPEFLARAGWASQAVSSKVTDDDGNVIGNKDFVFYSGTSYLSPTEAINEVDNMEEKQWKVR